MRVAVVADIHANLTALDAVAADIRRVGADLVVHAGDLVGGPRPAEVIDRIRELDWPGVFGNSDEATWNPDLIAEKLPGDRLRSIRDILLTFTVPQTVAAIGDERLRWLRALPPRWAGEGVTVVHASLDDAWRIVPAASSDDDLAAAFVNAGTPLVVYGHIHVPFVRQCRDRELTVVNTGAVSLSFDGDPRASYALIEDGRATIRRVEYDVEHEVALLMRTADPLREATAITLRTGRYAAIPVS